MASLRGYIQNVAHELRVLINAKIPAAAMRERVADQAETLDRIAKSLPFVGRL